MYIDVCIIPYWQLREKGRHFILKVHSGSGVLCSPGNLSPSASSLPLSFAASRRLSGSQLVAEPQGGHGLGVPQRGALRGSVNPGGVCRFSVRSSPVRSPPPPTTRRKPAVTLLCPDRRRVDVLPPEGDGAPVLFFFFFSCLPAASPDVMI